jgi:hypothetical protein
MVLRCCSKENQLCPLVLDDFNNLVEMIEQANVSDFVMQSSYLLQEISLLSPIENRSALSIWRLRIWNICASHILSRLKRTALSVDEGTCYVVRS